MSAQSLLKQEERVSRQGDFHGLLTTPNGGGVRLLPGEAATASQNATAIELLLTEPPDEQTAEDVLEIEGALVASTRFGEQTLPVMGRAELSADNNMTLLYFDRARTLSLQFVFDEELLNINTQYTEKPLREALQSARFLQALITTPGRLLFETSVPAEGGAIASQRIEVGDLPLAVPEPKLEEYGDRLRLLEALYTIMVNTGVEIRYPSNTENGEGLNNLNFVLKAIQSGWVASSVADFTTHIPATEVRAVLEELEQAGEVARAFLFEIPHEAYVVFGKEVNLGSSRRYVAAARLASSQEEMKSWLSENPSDQEGFDLRWEPMNNVSMHVFFEDWPKSSLETVERELREFEAIYSVSSERFKDAWEKSEAWTEGIQDGNRWFSFIQARDELARES